MKTETTMPAYEPALKLIEKPLAAGNEKTRLRVVRKNDFHNHSFAMHDNPGVQNSSEWDPAWFASYE